MEDTLAGGDTGVLDARLKDFAQTTGVGAIFLMDLDGQAISASNAGTAGSFVGQNYGFRPYFKEALGGALGEFYGIGATTGIPGYFYAYATRLNGAVAGVVAVKIELGELQTTWQASGERFMLTNEDGVVLLASEPSWRYQTLRPLSPGEKERVNAARQFGNEPLDALDWQQNRGRQVATIGGERFFYLSTGNLQNDWVLHVFQAREAVLTRAWLTTLGFVLVLGGGFVVWQARRGRQVRAALRRSEFEESQLRAANDRLAIEVEDRRTAERQLQKTQSDLERAGRLAALGQLASSVTHELGQPISAMRNHIAAAEISSGPTDLSAKMQTLVARMDDITRQLKFFSRKGKDQFEEVDLARVVDEALGLLTPNIEAIGAEVEFTPPQDPVMIFGNKLRLEQVVTNLVRNALDAVESSDERRVFVTLGDVDGTLWLDVADTGHGLGRQSLDDLREPFATTRESGKGMGLGLTISAGIVSDHDGVLSAENRAGGGAIFRAEFPKDRHP